MYKLQSEIVMRHILATLIYGYVAADRFKRYGRLVGVRVGVVTFVVSVDKN